MDTPILFLIFNRPQTTQLVFDVIRKAKPSKLYIAADGARKDKVGEDKLCEQTRAIIEQVNWRCEVKTLFREHNLGCKIAISSAINWFFDNEEQGIILEDDCLPDLSFFTFCSTLLKYYKDDTRIMHISGNNFQDGIVRGDGTYYFSKYNHIWGWATWKRTWLTYNVDMEQLDKALHLRVFENTLSKTELKFWLKYFNEIKTGIRNTWDYQTMLNQWTQNGLTIIPNKNLVTNIGFGGGTNTLVEIEGLSNIKRDAITEIIHPSFIYSDKIADEYTFNTKYNAKKFSFLNRLFRK